MDSQQVSHSHGADVALSDSTGQMLKDKTYCRQLMVTTPNVGQVLEMAIPYILEFRRYNLPSELVEDPTEDIKKYRKEYNDNYKSAQDLDLSDETLTPESLRFLIKKHETMNTQSLAIMIHTFSHQMPGIELEGIFIHLHMNADQDVCKKYYTTVLDPLRQAYNEMAVADRLTRSTEAAIKRRFLAQAKSSALFGSSLSSIVPYLCAHRKYSEEETACLTALVESYNTKYQELEDAAPQADRDPEEISWSDLGLVLESEMTKNALTYECFEDVFFKSTECRNLTIGQRFCELLNIQFDEPELEEPISSILSEYATLEPVIRRAQEMAENMQIYLQQV